MVAIALNPLAEEFTPCGTPPGLLEALTLPIGPPGVHTVAEEAVDEVEDNMNDDIPPPPGLSLGSPPGLSGPPGLAVVKDDEDSKCLAAPPGKFAPPGNFTPVSPPGMFAAGPPGFFMLAAGPPGVLSADVSPTAKDSDALSSSEFSTDADSDSESSLDGSFSE